MGAAGYSASERILVLAFAMASGERPSSRGTSTDPTPPSATTGGGYVDRRTLKPDETLTPDIDAAGVCAALADP